MYKYPQAAWFAVVLFDNVVVGLGWGGVGVGGVGFLEGLEGWKTRCSMASHCGPIFLHGFQTWMKEVFRDYPANLKPSTHG